MHPLIIKNEKYFNKFTVLITLVIFLLFTILVLPAESAKSTALGLEVSPDTMLFYTASRLYNIAQSFGIEGRRFYIHQRFTFDLLWPIAYGAFLFVTSTYFIIKLNLSKRFYTYLWLPIIAVAFDYLENMMTALVMYRYPNKTYVIDMLAGVMTLFKWVILALAFIVLIAWGVKYLHQVIWKRGDKNV